VAQECREGIRKDKAQLELNLARDMKNNRGFFRHIGQQRKMKETVGVFTLEKRRLQEDLVVGFQYLEGA